MPLVTKSFANAVSFTRASNATYFDSSGVLQTASTNTARIDYNPITLAIRGLLMEEQRTNLITYSEDFNNSIWQLLNSPIISQNFATAPNGSTSADLISTSVSASGLYRFITTTNSTVHTMSIFLKYVSGGTTVYFGCDSGPSNAYVTADISVGTITSSGVNVTSSSITNVGNGWYRITVTFTTTTTTPTIIIYSAGSAARSFLTWGAQLEAGAFATSYIPSSVTFSGRTSNGTYFDSTGTLQTAGSGVSRTTYNPSNLTAEPFLLLEESRTNSIRNNTMAGAAVGTPGTLPTDWFYNTSLTGLTFAVVGTGTETGITYIDLRINGTPSASGNYDIGFVTNTLVAALTGQTWTESIYYRLVSGSTTGISTMNIRFNEYTSGGAFITGQTSSNLTLPTNAAISTQRVSATATLSGGATTASIQPFLRIVLSGTAIDITLRIGMPQLEQGAYSTSVIPTSSVAVTRAADTSTSATTTRAVDNAIVNVNRWFYDTEGTIYIEAAIEGVGSSNYPWSIAVDNGTGSNRYGFYFVDAGADTYNKKMSTNGVGQIDEAGPVTLVANTFIKSAMAVKTNDLAAAYNGGNLQTDSSVNIPTNLTRLLIGSGDNTWSGWIKSVKYYPRRLTNAELQALTT